MKTRVDVSELRHPYERLVWWIAVVVNAAVCVLAVSIVIRGGEIDYERQIRAVAIAAVLAPPALVFTRNRRLARVRGGSIKVSLTQYAPLYKRLQEHCEAFGVESPPTLFVSDGAIAALAHSYSAWHREYVVLDTDFLEADLEPLEDVWSFLIARELGRLAFGHVTWWDELLLSYVGRIPYIRRPLRLVRAYSLDNVGAFLEPEGVRGLVVQASGRRTIPAVHVAEHIRHALSVDGFWVRLANLIDEQPLLAVRLRKLYDQGLFDLDHDLRRYTPAPDLTATG
jgi:hypothetical protein